MICDFDNDALTCPRCKFALRPLGRTLALAAKIEATGRTWIKNCDLAGVGDFLAQIIHSVGGKPATGCQCRELRGKMNQWGAAGCREHRAEIVEHLRKAYKGTSAVELLTAAAKAVTSGLAFKLNPLDPFGSLVDEAIRRAEASSLSESAV